MNIEEDLTSLKEIVAIRKERCHGFIESDSCLISTKRLETLLTAYEKEKGENVKLRLQDIPLMEGEVKAYKDRVNELKQELEKEKEDNKRLRKCHLQYEEMTGIDLLLPEKEE